MNFFQPRSVFWITLLVSAGALGAALIAQLGFGLKPCVMCLWQRLPYALLILGSLAALIATPRAPQTVILFLMFFDLLFLASAALAFFHFGIEQHWWSLEHGCKIGQLNTTDTATALAQVLATPQAECDKVAWRLLGFSITVWNTALSLGMAAYISLVMLMPGIRKKYLNGAR